MKDFSKKSHFVIMAGGSGTRFWPLSRKSRPKQFLPFGVGDRSLLGATVDRLASLASPDRIYVVTAAALVEQVQAEVPELPPEHILAEPVGRNTAPCIAWATATIRRKDRGALIAVLPADQWIANPQAYRATVQLALQSAAQGNITTIGIQPNRPETGYGYIEAGPAISQGWHQVIRFVEKPSLDKAQEMLQAGHFLWNSGMFFFHADVMTRAFAQHLPELAQAMNAMDQAANEGKEPDYIAANFSELPSISIDHGVMEKTSDMAVVPGDFGWSDVGGWISAWELAKQDQDGNAIHGNVVSLDNHNCYLRSHSDKVLAVVGLDDVVVVDTQDATLVIPKERAQDVRQIVAELRSRFQDRYV